MNIFVTGATNDLGLWVVKELVQHYKKVYLLVQPKSYKKACNTFKDFDQVVLCLGDLMLPSIVESQKEAQEILTHCQDILHMAYAQGVGKKEDKSYLDYLLGRQNLLHFISKSKNLRKFNLVTSLQTPQDDFYNDTKAQLKNFKLNVPVGIYSLGLVVGESQQGEFTKGQGPYRFLEQLGKLSSKKILINALKYLPLPYDRHNQLPLIPVDHAALVLVSECLKVKNQPPICKVVISSKNAPMVGDFLQDAFDAFAFKITVVPLPAKSVNDLLIEKIGLAQEAFGFLEWAKPLESYQGHPHALDYTDYRDILLTKASQVFTPQKKKAKNKKSTKSLRWKGKRTSLLST